MDVVLLQRKNVTVRARPCTSDALAKQDNINTYNLPFTANPVTGCLFGCRYCYLQTSVFAKHSDFGKEMIVKTGFVDVLKKQLSKYRPLPIHLRRVQIGNAAEVYHPYLEKVGRDNESVPTMRRILQAFVAEQQAGYPWAVHIVTKSTLVEHDTDLLSKLHCAQVEVTVTTLDENLKRQFEGSAPSVARRLETIRRLCESGIFVRVMAMPYLEDPKRIWGHCQALGAQAAKSKQLNYFDIEQLKKPGPPVRVKERNEDPSQEFLIHSGEHTGQQVIVDTWWKKAKKSHRGPRTCPVMDYGYLLIPSAAKYFWGDCC